MAPTEGRVARPERWWNCRRGIPAPVTTSSYADLMLRSVTMRDLWELLCQTIMISVMCSMLYIHKSFNTGPTTGIQVNHVLYTLCADVSTLQCCHWLLPNHCAGQL